MFQFLSIIFNGLIKSLEESGRRRARHYMTNYKDKGIWQWK